MGNNCFKNGFFQTISNSIWGSGSDEGAKANVGNEKEAAVESGSEEKEAPKQQPPEEIKIVKEEIEKEQEGKSREELQRQQSKLPPQRLDSKPALQVHDAVNKEEDPKVEPRKTPRRPHNVKRQSCAGLKIDSVLQTKRGNLKEFYSLGTKLGNGQFGTTFVCTEKGTGKQYACKSIAKRKLLTVADVDDVRREIQIMHHMTGHPNIVSIKGAYEDQAAVHVVMDLCSGGELFERIVKRGHYSERKAAKLARTIVGVVEACHSMGVMHRDLKPENFLFVNEEEDSPLKVIDFGLSIFFKPGDTLSAVVGSPYYVAPEVLKKCYGPEADVWSAGVVIYILLSGVPPFWGDSEQEIFDEILKSELDFTSDPWPSISASAKDLVSKMLAKDPKKRITAYEVLCHRWIQVDGGAPDKPLDSLVLGRMKQFSAMKKLKKLALRVIGERLSQEEIAGLKEMFKIIDTDNSGQITYEELKAGLQRFGANLAESEFRALMQAADINNSGTIDGQEFIAATMHLNMIEREENLLAAFSYFDRDGSGYITQEELQKACQEFGIDDIHLDEIMREVDHDNDGRIDYKEFEAMMHIGNPEFGKGLTIGLR
ncbi:Calcium-dependent protein kinase 2 [Hibiscus syriacus]|uniref:non-specific serine/threonine protein kinase n=1 Tax=Hibiscus syriacus TaxID=106335 RepID=A0A6A2YMS5_HIBSY|nr:calcium-dependent protein kinase 26-like [Hibiscus syriacus]KAE8680619.1 Calcium-dependent protein kinase 2 [Hibiscus syriacus]